MNIQLATEWMAHQLQLNMEQKACSLDQWLHKVFIQFIQDICNMILNILKYLALQLLLKILKCSEECKIEVKILLFISLLKLNLFQIPIQIILFLK